MAFPRGTFSDSLIILEIPATRPNGSTVIAWGTGLSTTSSGARQKRNGVPFSESQGVIFSSASTKPRLMALHRCKLRASYPLARCAMQ